MKVVKHEPPPQPPAVYDLVGLTRNEVLFLADLLSHVGGDPARSRRRLVEPLYHALEDAGLVLEGAVPDFDGFIVAQDLA